MSNLTRIKVKRIVLALILTSSTWLDAADEKKPQGDPAARPSLAVPFRFEVSASVEKNSPATIKTMTDVINTALAIVQAAPPPGNHFFNWPGDKSALKNKTVVLLLTDSRDSFVADMSQTPGGAQPTMDALTFGGKSRTSQEIVIGTLVLADRVFLDSKGNENPDALVRVVTALAHEFYGNVQELLEKDLNAPPAMSLVARRDSELRAFQAGIDFLERLMKNQIFDKLPSKTQNNLRTSLVREKAGLASWNTCIPSLGRLGQT